MSDDAMSTDPIDVGAVRRDDAFIDDLAAGRAADVADSAEYELAGLLAQWRVDSISSPIPTTPTINDIEAAIARANQRERRGGLSRRLRIVSGAAAILAVLGAGLLVMSEGSQPGDPLWGVKQVVFAEQAQQTQARVNAQDNIDAAKTALDEGDVVKAIQLLRQAEDEIGPIRDKNEAADLRESIKEIKERNPGKLITSVPPVPSTSPSQTVEPTAPTDEPSTSTSPTPSTSTTKPPSSSSEPSSTAPKPPASTTASGAVSDAPVSTAVR